MRRLVDEAGLQDRIVIDSAGTHDYHCGMPPDPRAQAVAKRRGYDLADLRARQVVESDFEDFDLILGMDFSNLERLKAICPPQHHSKLGLLMPYARRRRALIVHDPYHRSEREFELVLDYIEDACEGLVSALEPQAAAMTAEEAITGQMRKGARDVPRGASRP